jgi:hypothetical protein
LLLLYPVYKGLVSQKKLGPSSSNLAILLSGFFPLGHPCAPCPQADTLCTHVWFSWACTTPCP